MENKKVLQVSKKKQDQPIKQKMRKKRATEKKQGVERIHLPRACDKTNR